jgi:hypothetical protein
MGWIVVRPIMGGWLLEQSDGTPLSFGGHELLWLIILVNYILKNTEKITKI